MLSKIHHFEDRNHQICYVCCKFYNKLWANPSQIGSKCGMTIDFLNLMWYNEKVDWTRPAGARPTSFLGRSVDFWRDPRAAEFYERLQRPETSRIFVNLYQHYTPRRGTIEIPKLTEREELKFLANGYHLFSGEFWNDVLSEDR